MELKQRLPVQVDSSATKRVDNSPWAHAETKRKASSQTDFATRTMSCDFSSCYSDADIACVDVDC